MEIRVPWSDLDIIPVANGEFFLNVAAYPAETSQNAKSRLQSVVGRRHACLEPGLFWSIAADCDGIITQKVSGRSSH